MQLRHD
jgi:hypothetical protein